MAARLPPLLSSLFSAVNESERPTAPVCRTWTEKLYTLWLAMMMVAIVATGFGLAGFIYVRVTDLAPTISVDSIGELGEGSSQ